MPRHFVAVDSVDAKRSKLQFAMPGKGSDCFEDKALETRESVSRMRISNVFVWFCLF